MTSSIVLLGAPGSGKGTQANQMAELLSVPSISTGDMLRANVKAGTSLGMKAKSFMDQGLLVSDEIILSMVEETLTGPDCENGFILDGFPRNLAQARALTDMLASYGKALTYAIFLDVPEEEIVRRLTRRRVCGQCGAIFHLDSKPPRQDGICDECGATLVHRSDDQEDVIRIVHKIGRAHV